MSAGATERLSRLLAMVPWLIERQGVPLAQAASHFGISERQLISDLELLFVCGAPGHMPDDLIEAEWDSGEIYVGNAEALARPLRLSVDEAVSLLAGLRTLQDVPGLHERQALDSALAKLSAAAGEAGTHAGTVSADLTRGADAATLAALQQALAERRRVDLTYLVPSRDETTRREVDPIRLLNVAGQWYLEGWCYRADGVRRFRLDRVVTVTITESTAAEHAVDPVDLTAQLFQPSDDDAVVTVRLDEAARWVSEYYPVDDVQVQPDGSLVVQLRAADVAWIPRLALRLGGAMTVLAPQYLADRTYELASAALNAYANTDDDG